MTDALPELRVCVFHTTIRPVMALKINHSLPLKVVQPSPMALDVLLNVLVLHYLISKSVVNRKSKDDTCGCRRGLDTWNALRVMITYHGQEE